MLDFSRTGSAVDLKSSITSISLVCYFEFSHREKGKLGTGKKETGAKG